MKLWARVAVSVTLLGVILWLLPWPMVLNAVARLSPWHWGGVVLGFLAGHAVGVFKWRAFVRAGRVTFAIRDAVRCYTAGLFANLCLPSIVGGDLLRLVMAGRATGRPEAAVLGGVMDRLTDTTSLALLAGAGAAMAGSTHGSALVRTVSLALLVGLGGGVLVIAIAGTRPLARWPARLRRPVGRTLVGVRHLRRNPGLALRGLMLSLLIQGGFVMLNAGLGRAIGIEVALGTWFLAWPLAKVVSLVPISLGGLAVREASMAGFLAPFGVPLALGVTVSLLWQTVLIVGGLLGGGVWLLLSRGVAPALRPGGGPAGGELSTGRFHG